MRIAICDDDALFRTQVLEAAREYAAEHNQQTLSFSVFSGAEDLLDCINRTGSFDVYFLDVMMPGINGILLGKSIREADQDGRIIYMSTSSEYAIDAFSVNAFNYLLKPLEKESLFATLDKVIASIASRQGKSLIVKTNESSIRVPLDSILYAELNRRSIRYHLTNGHAIESIQIRTSFSEAVQNLLRDGSFVLCGASVAANMHHIFSVDKDSLHFSNGSKVYIPRKLSAAIRSIWTDFCFKEDDLC